MSREDTRTSSLEGETMRNLNLNIATLLCVGLLALPACGENEARAEASIHHSKKLSESEAGATQRPTNVKVAIVKPTSLSEYVVAYGTTEPIRDVTYSAEVPGRVEALPVDLGDRISRGRIIARIDYRTLQAQAEQASTSYNLAQNTYKRLASLKDDDIISRQQIDEAESAMLSTKAGLSIANANLKKAVVRSTYSGIVGAKFVEKGEYVGPGTPLIKVVDYKTIIVEAKLAETQTSNIERGAKVDVKIEALGETFKGTVDTLIPTADKASKTFTLRIKIANPDYKILVGMSAIVTLTARQHDDVLAVSQSTVIEETGTRSVFVAKDGAAMKRSVTLGAVKDDKVIIEDGLSSGDAVIIVGQRDLENGAPIHIVN